MSNFINFFLLLLLFNSCHKVEVNTSEKGLEQFLGVWVSYEYNNSTDPSQFPGWFGYYSTAFELIDTSGKFYSCRQYEGKINRTGEKGEINYSEASKLISFKTEFTEYSGKVVKIDDSELWIENSTEFLKLKKVSQ